MTRGSEEYSSVSRVLQNVDSEKVASVGIVLFSVRALPPKIRDTTRRLRLEQTETLPQLLANVATLHLDDAARESPNVMALKAHFTTRILLKPACGPLEGHSVQRRGRYMKARRVTKTHKKLTGLGQNIGLHSL